MESAITTALAHVLPEDGAIAQPLEMAALGDELEAVALEALDARNSGLTLAEAVQQAAFPALGSLHRELRDALLAEIPRELEPWVSDAVQNPDAAGPALADFQRDLFDRARDAAQPAGLTVEESTAQLQAALAEVLLFESVRLRLLVTAWSSLEFESLGGDEDDVDHIAWAEMQAILREPASADPAVRPLALMLASASVALARDAAERAEELRASGEDERERLRMRARLRAALRELRLPESVLLENALANLLDEERVELVDLQAAHPMALGGMSRQAMDQRVSRGRRALTKGKERWPSRRRPALFDLLRANDAGDAPS